MPDVSFEADPNFGGVAIYDSYQDAAHPMGSEYVGHQPRDALLGRRGRDRRPAPGLRRRDDLGRRHRRPWPALYSLPNYDYNDIVAGDNEAHGAQAGDP